jgi:predicted RNA binding protein YcfA (HicA-like mRNA interferase family)
MTKQQKLLDSLRQAKTFKWNKVETLFKQLNYVKKEMEGSRVRFYNKTTGTMALLHCPHPENDVKDGALKAIKEHLKAEGYL